MNQPGPPPPSQQWPPPGSPPPPQWDPQQWDHHRVPQPQWAPQQWTPQPWVQQQWTPQQPPVPTSADPRSAGQRARDVAHVHRLGPVAHPDRWKGWGFLLQVLGVAALVLWAWQRYKHDAVVGVAAKATVTLVYQETLHTRNGILVTVAAAVIFTIGSVIAARPYVRSVGLLAVAVPIAALAGIAILGAIVIVLALLYFLGNFDLGDWSSEKKKPKNAPPSAR